MPKVSIVICNYNHARFLESALTSACEQTVGCEVILVDDGSTDDSLQIAARWSKRVKVLSKKNEGQRSAYNHGFAACGGDFVLFLDADDWLRRDAVESALQHFTASTSRVHFRLQLSNEKGDSVGPAIPTKMAAGDLAGMILQYGILPPSSPASGNVYRRTVLQRLLPLPLSPTDKNGADFFTIYGSSLLGTVVAIPRILGHYRVVSSPNATQHNHFVLGNAARGQQRQMVLRERYQLFQQWIDERAQIRLTQPLHDFSELKVAFVQDVFQKPYLSGLKSGAKQLPVMGRALVHHANYSLPEKCAFGLWALVVLLAPRPWTQRLSGRVTNPNQRSRSR